MYRKKQHRKGSGISMVLGIRWGSWIMSSLAKGDDFTYIYRCIIKDTNEYLDEEVHRELYQSPFHC